MVKNPGFIRLSLIAPFLDHVRRQGVDPAKAFAALGLKESSVGDPEVFVHAELIYGLLNKFAQLTGDSYLGARVGEAHNFASWKPYAEAADGASTLLDFLVAFIRRVPTEASSVEHSLVLGVDLATYRVDRTIETLVKPIQVTGFACAHYVRILRSVTGKTWDPSLITFASKHMGGVPPGFAGIETRTSNHSGIELSFPAEWLFHDIELDLGHAVSGAPPSLEDVDLVAALRSAAKDQLGFQFMDAASVAEALGLEPDFLARALKRSGTTVSREIKRLRIDTAKALLIDETVTIGEIANVLGYKHQAHFTRFFVSQTGVSPSDFRARSRAYPT